MRKPNSHFRLGGSFVSARPVVAIPILSLLLGLLIFPVWDSLAINSCSQGARIGVFVGTPEAALVRNFEQLSERHIYSVSYYQGWDESNQPPFPAGELIQNIILHDGYDTHTIVHLTWEPWVVLTDITDGSYDTYLAEYAEDTRVWGRPIWLRFGHEMIQGDDGLHPPDEWYPYWQDQPEAYKAAFRHVVTVFRQAGADNVKFVWSPTNWPSDFSIVKKYYPGQDVVDWLGIDGFNCGPGYPVWQWFDDLFYNMYHTFTEHQGFFGDKPIMIGEFASAEAEECGVAGVTKATWIANAFTRLKSPDYGKIHALFWFNVDKERDWRIESSPESLQAFRDSIEDPYFISHPVGDSKRWQADGMLLRNKGITQKEAPFRLVDASFKTVALVRKGSANPLPYLWRWVTVGGPYVMSARSPNPLPIITAQSVELAQQDRPGVNE